MTAAYSASALNDQKKKIAEKAIQRWLFEEFQWAGTPEGGFQGGGWMEMLPPITGPIGTMQLRYHIGEQMNPNPGQPPPGAKYKGEDFSGGMGLQYYLYEVDPSSTTPTATSSRP
jgi:hypothetical protein